VPALGRSRPAHLAGGLGIIGRSFGLTCDSLLAAEVVFSEGGVGTCDEERHEDLFRALRDAGAVRFGVVTSFTFGTVAAQPACTTNGRSGRDSGRGQSGGGVCIHAQERGRRSGPLGAPRAA
jgi:FAD/FMN-containing dehydrogenase